MFRLEDNVPQYYLGESRDFQFFIRLQDSEFMGIREDINSVSNLNSAHQCKNNLLHLLANKVGFFTREHIDDNVLRNIISAFRTAVKNKGTKTGILQAAVAVLKAENTTDKPQITISLDDAVEMHNKYKITVYTPIKIVNDVALKEFLKYIIPCGFTYTIKPYISADENLINYFGNKQVGRIITSWNQALALVREGVNDFSDDGIYANAGVSNFYITDTSQTNLDVYNRLLSTTDLGMIADLSEYEKVATNRQPKIVTENMIMDE